MPNQPGIVPGNEGFAEAPPSGVSPADLAPADLAPADLAPADLAPADLAPAAPAPTDPAPANLAPAEPAGAGLSGRRGQAVRNDEVILRAARDVFLRDPRAPIAAVADRAGVGISALYRRYAGKEDLLRRLCHDGLLRFIAEAEAGAAEPDGWIALAGFLERIVDADVHSLTVHLAGTFTPTEEMSRDAQRASALVADLVDRAHRGGRLRLRQEVVAQDIGLLLEGCAAVRLPNDDRTQQLRRRYLAILLDGLSIVSDQPLPGPAPQPDELNWRWRK